MSERRQSARNANFVLEVELSQELKKYIYIKTKKN